MYARYIQKQIPYSFGYATFHKYDGGAYFVTICTAGMNRFFGEISDGEMQYTEIGTFAVRQVEEITLHYPYAEIPVYIVMPNHVHLIVFIDDIQIGSSRDVARNVSIKNTTPIHHTDIAPHVSVENTPTHQSDVARNVSTKGQ